MIEMSIKKLVQYGRTTGLIEAEDEIYARNQILEVLKMSEYEEPGEITPGTTPAGNRWKRP